MPRQRTTQDRRSRKQLQAELQRLSVPTRDEQPKRDAPHGGANRPRHSPQTEAEEERIRRMIEAAYT